MKQSARPVSKISNNKLHFPNGIYMPNGPYMPNETKSLPTETCVPNNVPA